MKKHVTCLALGVTVAILVSSPASSGPIDFTTLQLNGDAALVDADTVLRLVPAQREQAGNAYINTPFLIDSGTTFSTSFSFRVDGGSGADGLAFLIQNDPRGINALGNFGGSMGFSSFDGSGESPPAIWPSVAVEFDTWNNSPDGIADPNDNHVGVDINGSISSIVTATPSFSLEGDARFAWIDYGGGVLDIFLSETNTRPGTPLLSEPIDLAAIVGSQAFFGFGAGTGAVTDNHDIEAWSLDVSTQIPEPASLPLLASGLAGLGFIGWRKQKSR